MGGLVLYRGVMVDSERWERFEHRAGDIVISTPPKSGTTWTQMLCALMIFDAPTFPAKIDAMSPWLDMRIRSEDEVFDMYDRQTHRRFIKTHTPLDGIPMRDDVHYVVVGRDPRDVMVSWEHHMANMDLDVLIQDRADAIGLDDLVGEMVRLAGLCSIDLDRARLAELAPEAGIDRMRDRADEIVPGIDKSEHWKDPAGFFRSGAAGEWVERTTPADRARYDERVAELVPDDLARWVHEG